jgi:hypothetical protein
VAVAAAVVLMNARRFISYGAVMAVSLQLDDPGIMTPHYSRLDGRIASTFAAFLRVGCAVHKSFL